MQIQDCKKISTVQSTLEGICTVSKLGLSDKKATHKNSCTKYEYHGRIISTDSSTIIKKVYPSEAELITINNSCQCTESNCKEIFTSQSNLNLHLYKTHNKLNAMDLSSNIKQFYCPNIECIYHESEWFKSKKLLKQHYLKVHSPKTYKCETCNEGFSTKVYKNMHIDYCGVTFKCNECPLSYRRYESLLTHARRKNHAISEKASFKLVKSYNKADLSTSKNEDNLSNTLKTLLPNHSNVLITKVIITENQKRCNQSIQTEQIVPKANMKLSKLSRHSVGTRKNIRKTELALKRERLSSETQTAGKYIEKKEIYEKEQKGNPKPQSTHTYSIKLNSFSSNTNIDVNDIEFLKSSDIKRTSSGTQTKMHPVNEISYSSLANVHSQDSVNAESSDLNVNNIFDKIFQNCNMETQTDFIFGDDLFNDCDYYSNMYTQTCEDILLNELELKSIETQTVDEMLRSVESQTTVSQNRKTQVNCRDINHMETQTDMEFKHLLESINA